MSRSAHDNNRAKKVKAFGFAVSFILRSYSVPWRKRRKSLRTKNYARSRLNSTLDREFSRLTASEKLTASVGWEAQGGLRQVAGEGTRM